MDTRSSPINDIYGTTPQSGRPMRTGHAWLWILLGLFGGFAIGSLRPVMRLRPDPPRSVVGPTVNSNKAELRAQTHTARACWDYAVHSLQDTYPYGRSLPLRPPHASGNSAGNATAISVVCWPRLRVAWTQRGSWEEKYEWDTTWLTNSHGSFQKTVHNVMNYLNNLQ